MPSEQSTLGKLGAALLNATLMLVAIVLLLAVVLVWQVRGLADDMRSGLRSELTMLQPRVDAARSTAVEALGALDTARQAQPDAPPEVTQAQDSLRALIDDLSALDPAPENAEQAESVLRRLVFAIFATAARGLLSDPPAP